MMNKIIVGCLWVALTLAMGFVLLASYYGVF
jgi:hypothetical protein